MSEKTVTAYEYASDTNEYLGPYEIPVCESSGDVHLPKFMTFTPPPDSVETGKVHAWNGSRWMLIDDPDKLERPPMPDDYSSLYPEFIQWMIDNGLWTLEDEEKYQRDKNKPHDDPEPENEMV